MKTRIRYILKGTKDSTRYCGRALEVKQLSVQEKQDAIERALKSVPLSRDRSGQVSDPVEVAQLSDASTKEQVRSHIVRVSKKGGLTKQADLVALSSDDEWFSPTESQFDEIFCTNAIDYEALVANYNSMHVVKQSEVDAMMGEAMTVSVD